MSTIKWVNSYAGVGVKQIEIYRKNRIEWIQEEENLYAVLPANSTEYTDPEMELGEIWCYMVRFVMNDGTVNDGTPTYVSKPVCTGPFGTRIITGDTTLGLIATFGDSRLGLRMALVNKLIKRTIIRNAASGVPSSIWGARLNVLSDEKTYKFVHRGKYLFTQKAFFTSIATTTFQSLQSLIGDGNYFVTIDGQKYLVRFPTTTEYNEVFLKSFDITGFTGTALVTTSPLAGLITVKAGESASIYGVASDTKALFLQTRTTTTTSAGAWATGATTGMTFLIWEPVW